METTTSIMITTGMVYLVFGFLFSIVFLLKGLIKIDRNAVGTSLGFKALILPGTVLLWPILLVKWIKASKQNEL